MNLGDDFRPELPAKASDRLVIGHPCPSDARELPVHKVGTDLARQHLITPVANVFEQQQP